MRAFSLIAGVFVAVCLSGAAPAYATTLKCNDQTGFGPGNPSYYACYEQSGTRTCAYWAVRINGSVTGGIHCAG